MSWQCDPSTCDSSQSASLAQIPEVTAPRTCKSIGCKCGLSHADRSSLLRTCDGASRNVYRLPDPVVG